jgi:hypothetical protein
MAKPSKPISPRASRSGANAAPTPRIWTSDELSAQADVSLNMFVDRRLAEPGTSYLRHLAERRRALARLFTALRPIDPAAPDPDVVRAIVMDGELLDALRYAAGPPISEDDLGVLVTRKPTRINKRAIMDDPGLAPAILRLVCRVADPSRFPWIKASRKPTRAELRHAIEATAALHASQAMATERRGYGRRVEDLLKDRMEAMGYTRVAAPNGGNVDAPIHHPATMMFYPECSLRGRRADMVIGLPDGRVVAVEAKDSSSVVNSVKRVLNDTAAKAKGWNKDMGSTVVPVALISGVFGTGNLSKAQADGLFLVWAHDLEPFVDWLQSQ